MQWITDREHFEQLVARAIPSTKVSLWIATANLKDLRVPAPLGTRAAASRRGMSLLEVLTDLARRDVEMRILHARPPSAAFTAQRLKRRILASRLELRCCPRQHMKLVILDGRFLYLGSANLTGAGMGARGDKRRNFEAGIVSDDEYLLDSAQARYDAIWQGAECGACGLRRLCPKPLDLLE